MGLVYDTVKERTSYSRHDSEENISISIQKQAQANTLRVVNRIKKSLGNIRDEVPKDIKIKKEVIVVVL